MKQPQAAASWREWLHRKRCHIDKLTKLYEAKTHTYVAWESKQLLSKY